MKYVELTKLYDEKQTEVFNKAQIFWAFSQDALDECVAKNNNVEHTGIGGCGFLPTANVHQFEDDMSELAEWFEETITLDQLEREEILYELANHECFYTGEYYDVFEMFKGKYSLELIKEVYQANEADYD
jgi:hypothetical protein